MLTPVLHFAKKPIFTVLQLDKSEVYLKKDNGKSQTHQSALQWRVLVNHKVVFFLKQLRENFILFYHPVSPKHKFCILASRLPNKTPQNQISIYH